MKLISQLIWIYFYIGLVMLPITIYSYFSEGTMFYYLLVLEGVFIVPGLLFGMGSIVKKIRKYLYRILNKNIELEDGLKKTPEVLLGDILVVFAFVWFISGILFALPFYFFGMEAIDALFESFSGITTTGFSVITNLNEYPSDFLLYRSWLNWLGGLGITGFALSALKGLTGKSLAKIYGAPEDQSIFKDLFIVYLGLTTFIVLLLVISGLDLFDSVNLAFSTISNGGFSHREDAILNEGQKLIAAFSMFLGSISMLIYLNLFKRKFHISENVLFYFGAVVMLMVLLKYVGNVSWVDSLLYVFSTMTCGGYGYIEFNLNDAGLYLLTIAMLIGGMVVSTSGGIKIDRILVLLKFIKEQTSKYFKEFGDDMIVKVRLNGQVVDNNSLSMIISFVFLFVMNYFILTFAIMEFGYQLKDGLFVAASTLSNVGASTIDIPTMDPMLKVIIIVFMYLGRIEIVPIIALIGKLYLSVKQSI